MFRRIIPTLCRYSTIPETAQVSYLKEGTVMTGLNVLSGQTDPVALKDSEYPPWVWTLLTPKKTEFLPEEMLSREYIRFASKQKNKNKSKPKTNTK